MPRTNAELAERELVPFRAALDAGARMVMTGHFALPAITGDDLPASLSAAVLRDLLRGELRFDGVTVTDALDMHALAQGSAQIVDAIAALRAGEDLLLRTADRAAQRRLEEGLSQAERRGLVDADRHPSRDAPAPGAAPLAGRLRAAAARSSGVPSIRPSPPSWPARRSRSSATTTGCLPLRPAPTRGSRSSSRCRRPDAGRLVVTEPPTWQRRWRDITRAWRRSAHRRSPRTPTSPLRGRRPRVPGRSSSGRSRRTSSRRRRRSPSAVLATGMPTVTVALRTPWDLLAYPSARPTSARYGILPPSMEALAAALFGRAPSPAGCPSTIAGLYPRGHGMIESVR